MPTVGVVGLVIVAAFAAASGIATLPYTPNDPCIEYAREAAPYPDIPTQLVPYGLRCEYVDIQGRPGVDVLAPSTGAFVAWLVAVAAVLGVGVALRRHALARGVVAATLVLGMCGLSAQQVGLVGAMLFTAVVGPGLVLAVDQTLRWSRAAWLRSTLVAAALPTSVVIAWALGGFSGQYVAGFAFGLAAGALVAATCDRLIPASRPSPA